LLALQAYLPSLHPPSCDIEDERTVCKEVHGWNATLLYAALYISAFGEGCIRACLPSLGADQFDHEDPTESRQQSSFFNWYTFGISLGGLVGLILIVWLESRDLQGVGHWTWLVCHPNSAWVDCGCWWSPFLPQPNT
jgi:dipeptide/tripeptide permease